MDFIAFDLETIPNQLLPEGCKPEFDPESVKYGNTKDPVKMQAKEDAEREKFNDALSKKMSLDPSLCSVCTFGMAKKTGEEFFVNAYQLTGDDEDDDFEAISLAINTITDAYRERIPLISFNGLGFDLPVLFFRAIAQDIPIDSEMWRQINRRYANPHHYDLMQILAGWDKQRWKGQDFYAKLFGFDGKGDFDGSMVWPAYQAGDFETIEDYCKKDVIMLSKIFDRVEPWIKIEKREE